MTVEQAAQVSAFITSARIEHESNLKTKTKKNSDDKMVAKWVKDHGKEKYDKALLEAGKKSTQSLGDIAEELALILYLTL